MALVDDGSQPLVSVIIASYNHEKYIEASIASVAAQTYRNVELLVVDDGSSDGSVELLRGLQAKYGFDLRVQQNQGLSRTLNEAIARARGNLIVPFGSDDIMLPQRLEKQVAHMWDKPEVGICAGNIEIIDSNGRVMPGKEQRKRDLPFRRLDFDDLGQGTGPGAALRLAAEVLEREDLPRHCAAVFLLARMNPDRLLRRRFRFCRGRFSAPTGRTAGPMESRSGTSAPWGGT